MILAVCAGAASASLRATCGPFTDAAADAFCPFVLEILTLGITTGTTATTFDPTSDVTRLRMAAFLGSDGRSDAPARQREGAPGPVLHASERARPGRDDPLLAADG